MYYLLTATTGFAAENTRMPGLPPPSGYETWLDYGIATMDTTGPTLAVILGDGSNSSLWPENVTREQMIAAARQELDALKKQALQTAVRRPG